jgi:DNA-binding NarL/FixJ family response regulator
VYQFWRQTRVLVVGDGALRHIFAAVRVGAHGYVSSRATSEELFQAITRATEEQEFTLPERFAASYRESVAGLPSALEGRLALEELPPRERQIAVLMAEGMTNREASAILYISIETVKWHAKNVLRKLGVRNRAQLAACWRAYTVKTDASVSLAAVSVPC